VFPLLTVLNVSNDWGASVHLDDPSRAAAWFGDYWQAFELYAATLAVFSDPHVDGVFFCAWE
jgi:hypothetical protein